MYVNEIISYTYDTHSDIVKKVNITLDTNGIFPSMNARFTRIKNDVTSLDIFVPKIKKN